MSFLELIDAASRQANERLADLASKRMSLLKSSPSRTIAGDLDVPAGQQSNPRAPLHGALLIDGRLEDMVVNIVSENVAMAKRACLEAGLHESARQQQQQQQQQEQRQQPGLNVWYRPQDNPSWSETARALRSQRSKIVQAV